MVVPDCIFCKIAAKEIEARIIYEDQQVVAIEDINPAAPVHILLIPKTHVDSLDQASDQNSQLLGHIQLLAAQLARKLNIAQAGYRVVNNCGEGAGQSVLHLHYHLLGGREMRWPPG
ncbi:MAG TPA: histidine triad nucleotide-binding protein [Syntrophomonadaceae bacterium]|nr:histidine triad nucleotide-binding protein [Syntrophomonadaceae bacterium]